jgi:hypothetical protein
MPRSGCGSAPRILVDATFFETNPTAIHLLEFKGDPAVVQPWMHSHPPYRVVTQNNDVHPRHGRSSAARDLPDRALEVYRRRPTT